MSRFEDSTGFNASYNQRLEFYYDLLSFWNTVIKNYTPNVFVAYTWPHLQSDYPLYLLSKYYYKIPVIFIDPYPHFNNRFTIMNSMENRSLPFIKNYKSQNKLNIQTEVQDYIDKIKQSSTDSVPNHMKRYFDYQKKYHNKNKEILSIFSLAIKGRLFKDSNQSIKK